MEARAKAEKGVRLRNTKVTRLAHHDEREMFWLNISLVGNGPGTRGHAGAPGIGLGTSARSKGLLLIKALLSGITSLEAVSPPLVSCKISSSFSVMELHRDPQPWQLSLAMLLVSWWSTLLIP